MLARRRDVLAATFAATACAYASPALASQSLKLVIVGDGAIGKTSALLTYVERRFPGLYVPTAIHSYTANAVRRNVPVQLEMWDTSAAQDYDRLRPLLYSQTNVMIVAYSVVSPSSFDSVRTKWVPEIRTSNPDIPILLAGLKTDLRSQELPDRTPKTRDEGWALAEELGLRSFRECSALTQEGLPDVFDAAIDIGRGHDPEAATPRALGPLRDLRIPRTPSRSRRPAGE